MNPRRFILMFLAAAIISVSLSFFFSFAAQILQDARVVFVSFITNILFTFLFSWLYFKKIPTAPWRSRVEAIAVWMGLLLMIDAMILYFILGSTVASLSTFSLFGYMLNVLALLVAAYVTKDSTSQITSPNLKLG